MALRETVKGVTQPELKEYLEHITKKPSLVQIEDLHNLGVASMQLQDFGGLSHNSPYLASSPSRL